MNTKELKNGKTFIFDGENVTMEVSFGKILGGGSAFKIWFNGAFIKICKTFKPIEKKVNELKIAHALIEQS